MSTSTKPIKSKKKLSFSQVKQHAYKKENTFYHVFITEPLTVPILYVIQNVSWLTPYVVSYIGVILLLFSTWAFFTGQLLLGAGLYFLGYFADSLDGKLARIRGIASKLGGFNDTLVDLYKQLVVTFGLSWYVFNSVSDPLQRFISMFVLMGYVALVGIYGALVATGYGLNNNKQIMNIIVEKESKRSQKNQSLFVTVKLFLKRHRLRLGYTTAETNAATFILGPILAAFFGVTYIFYGYILAIVMILLLSVVFIVLQWKQLQHEEQS